MPAPRSSDAEVISHRMGKLQAGVTDERNVLPTAVIYHTQQMLTPATDAVITELARQWLLSPPGGLRFDFAGSRAADYLTSMAARGTLLVCAGSRPSPAS